MHFAYTRTSTQLYIYKHTQALHYITQQLVSQKLIFLEREVIKLKWKSKIDGDEEDSDRVVHHVVGGDVFDYGRSWLQSLENRANQRLWSNDGHRRRWWFWLFLGDCEQLERPSFDEELGFPISLWPEQERTRTLMTIDIDFSFVLFFFLPLHIYIYKDLCIFLFFFAKERKKRQLIDSVPCRH